MPNDENLSPAAVKKQLDRILASADFVASDALNAILSFVVGEWLAGRADQLKGYTIAVKALGRRPDFNSQTDTIVRVQAGRLRRALQHYYFTVGAQDVIQIEIPKGTYAPQIYAAIKDSSSSTLSKPSEAFIKGQSHAIAVTRFSTTSKQGELISFATGLSDEVVMVLTQIPQLSVIGPLLPARLQSEGLGPRGVGQKYNVRYVLEGSLSGSQGRMRVWAKLVDTLTGINLWTNRYDMSLEADSLFTIQEDITYSIVGIVGVGLDVIDKYVFDGAWIRPGADMTMQKAMLRYLHYHYHFSDETSIEAVRALEQAVIEAPNYAPAWAALGILYVERYASFFIDQPEFPNEAYLYLEKAKQIAPEHPETIMASVFIYYFGRDMGKFNAAVETAVAAKIPATFLADFGYYLSLAGDFSRGLPLIRKAQAQNPHLPEYIYEVFALYHYYKGDYEAALADLEKLAQINTEFEPFALLIFQLAALGQLNRQEQVREKLKVLRDKTPDINKVAWIRLRRWILFDDLFAALIAGLQKAGLELSAPVN